MHFDDFSFGSVEIDGILYENDVVIDRGEVRRRKKAPSKQFRDQFGHTPLSLEEDIPWKCTQLVIGTGAHGNLPVMVELRKKAHRKGIKLVTLPTLQALELLNRDPKNTNAILHVTC